MSSFVFFLVINFLLNELFSLALVPLGSPFKYLFDKKPCAKGEKAIHPTPFFKRVLVRPFSIQRLIKE